MADQECSVTSIIGVIIIAIIWALYMDFQQAEEKRKKELDALIAEGAEIERKLMINEMNIAMNEMKQRLAWEEQRRQQMQFAAFCMARQEEERRRQLMFYQQQQYFLPPPPCYNNRQW